MFLPQQALTKEERTRMSSQAKAVLFNRQLSGTDVESRLKSAFISLKFLNDPCVQLVFVAVVTGGISSYLKSC